jgi:hypothetical protein
LKPKRKSRFGFSRTRPRSGEIYSRIRKVSVGGQCSSLQSDNKPSMAASSDDACHAAASKIE